MATRRSPLGRLLGLVGLAVTVSSTACVDTFGGANVVLDFYAELNENLVDAQTNPSVFGERRGGVTGPQNLGVLLQHEGADPATLTPGAPFAAQPPPNTHYLINWTQRSVNADGEPARRTFTATRFEIVPSIDLFEPCLIDTTPTDWPGIHATAVQARLAEDLGFETPLDASTLGPADPIWDSLTDNEKARVFDAARRLDRQRKFAGRVLAVVPHYPLSPAEEIGVDTTCAIDPASDPGLIPPFIDPTGTPVCFDDESNQRRLELCQAYFDEHPDYYVGNDRVLTLPAAGVWYGTVASIDPRDSTGLGRFLGAEIPIDADMERIDSLSIAWQWDDDDGDGAPDVPDMTPPELDSEIGVFYLGGDADPTTLRQRSVINIHMSNPTVNDSYLRADASVTNNLDEDEITF